MPATAAVPPRSAAISWLRTSAGIRRSCAPSGRPAQPGRVGVVVGEPVRPISTPPAKTRVGSRMPCTGAGVTTAVPAERVSSAASSP